MRVLLDLVPVDPGLVLRAPGVRLREESAQPAPAARRLDQQPNSLAAIRTEEELAADDGAESSLLRRRVETRNAVDAVAVGQSECWVAELGGALGQLFGVRSALQEREGAAAAQLDVVVATPKTASSA